MRQATFLPPAAHAPPKPTFVSKHDSSSGCFSVIILKLTASTVADYCYFDIKESIFVHLQDLEHGEPDLDFWHRFLYLQLAKERTNVVRVERNCIINCRGWNVGVL